MPARERLPAAPASARRSLAQLRSDGRSPTPRTMLRGSSLPKAPEQRWLQSPPEASGSRPPELLAADVRDSGPGSQLIVHAVHRRPAASDRSAQTQGPTALPQPGSGDGALQSQPIHSCNQSITAALLRKGVVAPTRTFIWLAFTALFVLFPMRVLH